MQTPVHAQEIVEMEDRNVEQVQSTSVELPPVLNSEPHDMSCAPRQLGAPVFDNGPTAV